MRYFLLLVCLTASMMAHAYNEAITSIAYNPSRMGAFDYLKVNNLNLKSGLWNFGDTTEINLYGAITVVDSRAADHQYNSTSADPTKNLHEFKRIIPMSNYTVDSDNHTFCTNLHDELAQTWLYNPKACDGNTIVSPTILMGVGNPTLTDSWPTSASTSALIPKVYMYGGEITSTGGTPKYSWIRNIKSMYITGSGSAPVFNESNTVPPNLSIQTVKLERPSSTASTAIRVKNSLTLSGMTMQASAFNRCTSNDFQWIERTTDNHKKIKILACK